MKKIFSILPGDKVGLISPAGPVTKEQIQNGLETLTRNNIQFEFGKHAFSNHGIVSATVKDRLEDINHFLKREDIKALWALRGGYGSIQLLKKFDYSLLEKHPKLLIGFSDLTALQWAIFKQTGLASLSGLILTTQCFPENPFVTLGMKIISGQRTDISENDLQGSKIQIIMPGKAEGTLIGGTLAMICSLCGTSFFIDRDDLILFLEDVNEPLYRIDRYFRQLALMDFWSKVKGVILGQFLNAEGTQKKKSLNVEPLLKSLLPTHIPIISNFPYGHIMKCLPLPQGVLVDFRADPFRLVWDSFIEA